jgi:hypothetical protein
MTSRIEPSARFRRRAEELRAEASKTSDPAMRERLLRLAKACEEMATWKLRKSKEW